MKSAITIQISPRYFKSIQLWAVNFGSSSQARTQIEGVESLSVEKWPRLNN